MNANPLSQIKTATEPLRAILLDHPVYARIDGLGDLRLFMESHAFAVWDFMSLLKALQRRACCVDVPWTPPGVSSACRLVNEIVLGEESDDDGEGGHASHFDLYRRAMTRAGADTGPIDRLVDAIRRGSDLPGALARSGASPAVRRFVGQTFAVIDSGSLPAIASSFAFGREDLLPDVFRKLVDRLDKSADGVLGPFRFYLDRHIEVDGDDHGPMAADLVAQVCGDDPAHWRAARDAAVRALEARKALWDDLHDRIVGSRAAVRV